MAGYSPDVIRGFVARFGSISADDVRRLVDRLSARGLAPGTVISCVNILSGLLRYAVKRKIVAHNVVRDLDWDDRPGSRRQSEPRYLTSAEIEAILAALRDAFRPVAYTCTYAGFGSRRRSACAGATST